MCVCGGGGGGVCVHVGVTEVECLGDGARLVMHNLCTFVSDRITEFRGRERDW